MTRPPNLFLLTSLFVAFVGLAGYDIHLHRHPEPAIPTGYQAVLNVYPLRGRNASAPVQRSLGDNARSIAVLAQELAAGGVEPGVIAAVLQGLKREAILHRQALQTQAGSTSAYWKPPPLDPVKAAQASYELRQLERTWDSAIQLVHDAGGIAPRRLADLALLSEYGPLPDDKIRDVRWISEDYEDVRQAVSMTIGPFRTGDDLVVLSFLEKEKERDMQRLLTPEDFLEYQLRHSPIAERLRSSLERFMPTEREFGAIFNATLRAEKTVSSVYITIDDLEANSNAWIESRKTLLQEIRVALGKARWLEYHTNANPLARGIYHTATVLGLSDSSVQSLMALQKSIQFQARELAKPGISNAERNERLSALEKQAWTETRQLLKDPFSLSTYVANGGTWLYGLADSIQAAAGNGLQKQ